MGGKPCPGKEEEEEFSIISSNKIFRIDQCPRKRPRTTILEFLGSKKLQIWGEKLQIRGEKLQIRGEKLQPYR